MPPQATPPPARPGWACSLVPTAAWTLPPSTGLSPTMTPTLRNPLLSRYLATWALAGSRGGGRHRRQGDERGFPPAQETEWHVSRSGLDKSVWKQLSSHGPLDWGLFVMVIWRPLNVRAWVWLRGIRLADTAYPQAALSLSHKEMETWNEYQPSLKPGFCFPAL